MLGGISDIFPVASPATAWSRSMGGAWGTGAPGFWRCAAVRERRLSRMGHGLRFRLVGGIRRTRLFRGNGSRTMIAKVSCTYTAMPLKLTIVSWVPLVRQPHLRV